MDNLKVVSLFDGIGCGRVALDKVGFNIDKYIAYEIDKSAMFITNKNYPDIIQKGNVNNADFTEYIGYDLLIGGSPCQGFSFAGNQLNFNDSRSKLFFDFVRALDIINPKYFILENVKMKKEYQDIISEYLGVQPIEINSSLVSAQNRKRLYWTNIPNVTLPIDKQIYLKDIIHEYNDNINIEEYKISNEYTKKILEIEYKLGKIKCINSIKNEYNIHNKNVDIDKYEEKNNYLFGCLTPNRLNKRQMGQRFNNGKKFYTLTTQDRHGILINGYIRKITPIECERLQTLPDNYTEGISDTQRYKSLGNGWTVDVISHILKNIK